MVYEQSDQLRKRFNFLFEAVSNKLRSDLTEQRKNMNLTELKKYGEETGEIRKYNFNRLSKISRILFRNRIFWLDLTTPTLFK